MPIANSATADRLRVGYKTNFQQGMGSVPAMRDRVSTLIRSTAASEMYSWLGEMSGMREWVGPRLLHSLTEKSYEIANVDYEDTVQIPVRAIEDDKLGTYAGRFEALGRAAAVKPEELVFGALAGAFSTICYDGQYMIDSDHPILDANGNPTTFSNTGGGSGTAWYLMASRGPLKPIILQERQAPRFVSMDQEESAERFMNRRFLYGVEARWGVGYGIPQTIYGSKQTLDSAAYATARAAIMSMKTDYGRPMGLMPDLLVVPPSLESAARTILMNEQISGSTNPWRGSAEMLVVPYLT